MPLTNDDNEPLTTFDADGCEWIIISIEWPTGPLVVLMPPSDPDATC